MNLLSALNFLSNFIYWKGPSTFNSHINFKLSFSPAIEYEQKIWEKWNQQETKKKYDLTGFPLLVVRVICHQNQLNLLHLISFASITFLPYTLLFSLCAWKDRRECNNTKSLITTSEGSCMSVNFFIICHSIESLLEFFMMFCMYSEHIKKCLQARTNKHGCILS